MRPSFPRGWGFTASSEPERLLAFSAGAAARKSVFQNSDPAFCSFCEPHSGSRLLRTHVTRSSSPRPKLQTLTQPLLATGTRASRALTGPSGPSGPGPPPPPAGHTALSLRVRAHRGRSRAPPASSPRPPPGEAATPPHSRWDTGGTEPGKLAQAQCGQVGKLVFPPFLGKVLLALGSYTTGSSHPGSPCSSVRVMRPLPSAAGSLGQGRGQVRERTCAHAERNWTQDRLLSQCNLIRDHTSKHRAAIIKRSDKGHEQCRSRHKGPC